MKENRKVTLLCLLVLLINFSCKKEEQIVKKTEITTKGLILHYTFDKDGTDISPSLNHAYAIRPINYLNGLFNKAAYLDGLDSSGYICSKDIEFTNEFTISVWVKSDFKPDNMIIIQKGFTYHKGICLLIQSNGVPQLHINDEFAMGGGGYDDNKWHHFVVTFRNDSINKRAFVNFYKDNNQDMYDEDMIDFEGFDYDATVNNSVSIGTILTRSYSYYDFKGFMDEFRMYNRVLSSKEISNLFLEM